MIYPVKTPAWMRLIYPQALWRMPASDPVLYLSFDDGPHPEITPFVLDCLNRYEARATFFCVGQNVEKYPGTYALLLQQGHRVGNHTFHHLNGWRTPDDHYLDNIQQAGELIRSDLFRPPYGRIRFSQQRRIRSWQTPLKLVMWDVLSGDFDTGLTAERCTGQVIRHSRPGSIVVFHDSEKAFPRLEKSLPHILKYYHEKGFRFEALP